MVIHNVQPAYAKRSFKLLSVNSQERRLGRFDPANSRVRIQSHEEPVLSPAEAAAERPELKVGNVPGLTAEVTKLNRSLHLVGRPLLNELEAKPAAVLITGVRGSGKTHLANKITATGWGKVFYLKHQSTNKSTAIREMFLQAREQMPSIILIDELDQLLRKDRANHDLIVQELCAQLDAIYDESQSKMVQTPLLVVATCLDFLDDIPATLQTETRFGTANTISIPIPTISQRLEILKSLNQPFRPSTRDKELSDLAKKMHAYTPRDIKRLVQAAWDGTRFRHESRSTEQQEEGPEPLLPTDFEQVWEQVRPSAMHEISLKPPTVRWSDVGGQENLKNVLQKMITHATVST